MASYTYCRVVFAIPELLERILLCLPPRSIFGVQRVASCWYAMVTTSTTIRRRLFLEVSGEAREDWVICEGASLGRLYQSRPTRNRSSTLAWIPSDCYLAVFDKSVDPKVVKRHMVPARLNPLLRLGRPDEEGDFREMRHPSAQRLYHANERIHFTRRMPLSGTGSWRATYVTDPPCRRANFFLFWDIGGRARSGSQSCGEIYNIRGLTLGDIVDSVLSPHTLIQYQVGGMWRQKRTTLRNVVRALEARRGAQATIDTTTSMSIPRFGIPSEAEWCSVQGDVSEGGGEDTDRASAAIVTHGDRRREGGDESKRWAEGEG